MLAYDRSEQYPTCLLPYHCEKPSHVNMRTTRGVAAGIAILPLLLACVTPRPAEEPAAARPDPQPSVAPAAAEHQHAPAAMPAAQHQHMEGMPALKPIPTGAMYTAADVHFMQGMIAHHGQAIHMSRLAAARGASPRVLRFAIKIDQSQEVEIRQMQEWLREKGQAAPEAESWRTMSMPGMLTAEQLARLDSAKGREFDREFLTLMIQHHQGALRMVADLFATPRAAQDVNVSVFATDVEVTQTAEIGIMQQMLDDL